MVKVQCGSCGKQFAAKPELAGKRVKCSGCGNPITVPAAAGAAAPAKPSPPRPKAAQHAAAQRPAAPQSSLADILEDKAPGELLKPTMLRPGETLCPQCNAAVPYGGSICVKCGLDLRGGKSLKTVEEKPMSQGMVAFLKALAAFGILLLVHLVCFGLFFGAVLAARSLELGKMELPWRNVCYSLLFMSGILTILFQVSLIADAFAEGMLKGFLFLFIPPFQLYFILTRWEKCRKAAISLAFASWTLTGAYVMFLSLPEEEPEPKFKTALACASAELPNPWTNTRRGG